MTAFEIKTDRFDLSFGKSINSLPEATGDEIFAWYMEETVAEPVIQSSFYSLEAAKEEFQKYWSDYGRTRELFIGGCWHLVGELAWLEENRYIADDGIWEFDQFVCTHDLSAQGHTIPKAEAPRKTVRDIMKEEGGNLGWCKPYIHTRKGWALAVNSGEVAGMLFAGEDINPDRLDDDLLLRLFAKAVNTDYDCHTGYDDLHIALEAMSERSCRNCPWFDMCDAMDEEIDDLCCTC